MKKTLLCSFAMLLAASSAFALDTVFDSMDKATEVKLAPAIKTNSTIAAAAKVDNTTATTPAVATTNKGTSLKTQKFNTALVNLDDAQVELRQELSEVTAKYNVAVEERDRAIANCKNLKREINAINKKMKNVDKSKKMINKSLESE